MAAKRAAWVALAKVAVSQTPALARLRVVMETPATPAAARPTSIRLPAAFSRGRIPRLSPEKMAKAARQAAAQRAKAKGPTQRS